jgi:hypothetical protein
MRVDEREKILERLATSEKTTIVVERAPDGKMRVISGPWDGEKVILKDQVLEIRNVQQPVHVARKTRHHDDLDPPVEPYHPREQGQCVTDDTHFVIDYEAM